MRMSNRRISTRDAAEGFLRTAERVAPLSKEAAREIANLLEPRTFVTGSYLLRSGERAEWCHYLAAGIVRELYVAADGAEHTRSFIAEGDVTGSLIDLLSGQPSITFIEAIEETSTLAFRHRDLEQIAVRHPEVQLLMRRWAEQLYVRKTRREHDMLALTAAVRHANWLAQYGPIDKRVRRRDLASYLGITPEHLSRLRRRR